MMETRHVSETNYELMGIEAPGEFWMRRTKCKTVILILEYSLLGVCEDKQ
jgi:hypothetical protein